MAQEHTREPLHNINILLLVFVLLLLVPVLVLLAQQHGIAPTSIAPTSVVFESQPINHPCDSHAALISISTRLDSPLDLYATFCPLCK